MIPKQPPKGYEKLPDGISVHKGDFWLRPYDNTWIESGTAHWDTYSNSTTNIIARKTNIKI